MYRNIKGWSPLSAVAQDTESTSAYIQKTMHFESEIAELLFKAVLASKVKISKVILSYHNLGDIKEPLRGLKVLPEQYLLLQAVG